MLRAMTRAITSTLTLALLALPLFAEEAKKSETPKTETTQAAAAPAQPAPVDSPLVAAAKRANRLGKKPSSKIVITNETLKSAGGNAHVTTSEVQPAIKLPPPAAPTSEMLANADAAARRKAAQETAAKTKADQEKRQGRVATRTRTMEESSGDREGVDDYAEDYRGRPEDEEQPPPGDQPPPPPPPQG